MSFVQVSKAEFQEWVDKHHPDFQWMLPKRGKEWVLCKKDNFFPTLEYHVYTTLEGETTRAVGEDAIRIQLFDSKANKIVSSEKKVLRTEGRTTVFDRINDRLLDLRDIAHNTPFCNKCGSHKVERENRSTGQKFYGCAAFPGCPDLANLKNRYPLVTLEARLKEKAEATSVKVAPELAYKRPVLPETELLETEIPTSSYPHINYKFPTFNRVQSTLIGKVGYDTDCNLVLGTATSTGKTISAEIFMGHTLSEGGKVVYVSPLKSLTQEKYSDWSETFADKNICILTGDYVMTPQREREINEADIICLTSEMLDSRSRKHQSEKSSWMKQVGLVVVDESHILTAPERGHAVEAGLVRFAHIVPQARLLLLSATMPNVGDFERWLTKLNGKPTKVVNSSWRPTQLDWNFVEFDAVGTYSEIRNTKMQLALQLVKEKPDEKYLVFVHDKNTGRALQGMFIEEGIEVGFHNGDLSLEDRLVIEGSFRQRDGGSRVMIATSTVAWGVSMPARNVVIVGTHRGINEVDELDIIQMGGRAGRFGIDPKGDVFLITENAREWRLKIQYPRPVESTLLQPEVLGFHILAEIQTRNVTDRFTLDRWFDRTLAKVQAEVDAEMVASVLAELKSWGMVVETESGQYRITRLGAVSASLYYFPRDIYEWSVKFGIIAARNGWDEDLNLAYALGTCPSWQLGYVPRNDEERVQRFSAAVRGTGVFDNVWNSLIAADVYDLLCGHDAKMGVRQVQYDAERICTALQFIDRVKDWKVPDYWKLLQLRLKYGAPADIAALCAIPGVGVARARKLHTAGIKTIEDFTNPENIDTVTKAVGKSVVAKSAAWVKIQKRLNIDDE